MKDLRGFLNELDAAGLLLELGRPVDPANQCARLMRELEERELAGLFTNVEPHNHRLVYNLTGGRKALALALGANVTDVRDAFADALRNRLEPVVKPGRPPVQEIVLEEGELDLRRLPLVTHSAGDAGPYITAGMVIARDPETGRRNVSVNRMMLVGARDAGIRMMPPQQLGQIQAKAEARGVDLPVVVAIGLHPADMVAAATSLPFGEDELALAGGLRREPFPLAPAVSCDLEVPAHAEIVLEGVVLANVREPEGPFGDFMEYYVPEALNHRFRLTALTHRADPVFQTMRAGSPEDVNLLGISREVEIFGAVSGTDAEVVDVRLAPTILGCTISVRQRFAGEAKAIAEAAFGSYRWLKYCIVVDDDVDAGNSADVLWAVATRARASEGVSVIRADGFPRDPVGALGSKLLIDATLRPEVRHAFRRRQPPGGERLRLDDFLKPDPASTD